MSILRRYPIKAANNRMLFPYRRWKKPCVAESNTTIPAAEAIQKLQNAKTGFIYGKIGTTELLALEFADRRIQPRWPARLSWRRQAERLFVDSGVFPKTEKQFKEFLDIYKKSVSELDGINLWQEQPFLKEYEMKTAGALCPSACIIHPHTLFPFYILDKISSLRWLVVSPFTKTMKEQLPNMPDVYRSFSWAEQLSDIRQRCEFVRCPLFAYMESSPYVDWSEGVARLAEEILSKQFDIAIVGAGAWSLPLLAKIKKSGKKGIHLGGATQILFGIKGRRWDGYCKNVYNEYWVRPDASETPAGHMEKEGGCYW